MTSSINQTTPPQGTKQLLACPFCGGKAGKRHDFGAVGCLDVNCPAYPVASNAADWNTRAPDTELLAALPNLGAIDALRLGQQQLDADGVMVGVSRQALDELLDWFDRVTGPHIEAAITRKDKPHEG